MPYWSCSVPPGSCCSPPRPRRTPRPAHRHRRRLVAVGGRVPGRLGPCLRGHASGLRRERRRLAGDVHASRRQLRVQGRAQRLVERELRPPRAADGANIPAEPAVGGRGQVLLRPRVALGHRQPKLGDRRRAGQLPVRARLPGGLGSHLPALVARGPRRRRHLHVRDDGAAGRVVRDEGRDQRGLGRELRPGWGLQRLRHPVQRPGRQHEGDLQLRRCVPRADGDRRDACRRSRLARARCRTSTWHGRIASAPPATRPRRSGTRSRTASSATSTTRRSTTRTSRRSSTSSPTARRSPTSRRAT